jgi:hypothetical protein
MDLLLVTGRAEADIFAPFSGKGCDGKVKAISGDKFG